MGSVDRPPTPHHLWWVSLPQHAVEDDACSDAALVGVGHLPVGHNLADDSLHLERLLPPPRSSTHSPCRSAAHACASVLGLLRGAERCGRRCQSRRSRGRTSSLVSRSSVCSCSTYATGRAQSQSCPGSCAS
eukprot:4168366-Pleurochrysis_carterae.AAC.1